MIRIYQGMAGTLLLLLALRSFALPEPDRPFRQAVSVKYANDVNDAILKKIAVDYNNIVYVLSDKGLLRVCEDRLVKDTRFTPLADLVPVDIAVQETRGHLYYLYEDHVLTNGYAGEPYFSLPKGEYKMLAVNANGEVLVANERSLAICIGTGIKKISGTIDGIRSVRSHNGRFYALAKDGIYVVSGTQIRPVHLSGEIASIAFRKEEIICGTAEGYYSVSASSGKKILPLQRKVPVQEITALKIVNGEIWAATPRGGFTQNQNGSFRYYASKRWLDDDEIKDIASDSDGNVYFLTKRAVNEVHFISQTLLDKTKYFQGKIRKSHIRYGFISNVDFTIPGDESTARLTDTDNDGLWSSFYLGSQAFRYGVTKDPRAKRYAWECFEAFERLLSVNGLNGFPSRTFERKGFKNSDPSRWHDSPDSGWEWEGTTSSDEFVAYIWVGAVMSEMAAETKEEKERVATFIDKILTHIIDNNYYFIDADGKPTLWGRWNPEYINSFPKTVGDRRLGSTTIIAGLELAYKLTGKEKYKTEAFKLMNQYGYLENIQLPYENIGPTKGVIHLGVDLGDGGWNHSDDEMAFLTYWVLYRYAFDANLKSKFADAIRDHWNIEKPEKNPVWNLITYGTIGVMDKPSTIWSMREFPMDLVRWKVKNSDRKDIERLPPNFRNQTTKELLPPGELPMHRHNANSFTLDGGDNGMSELAGDEYLLPYWMARYLKVID
jgi:hypothetical protein